MEETPFPTLQPDSLIQIFHKLPILSLSQSKLVCKEWCSLISDPFFKSNYNPASIPRYPLNLMMIPRMHNQERVESALIYEINGSETRVVTHHQPLPRNISSENPNLTIVGSWNGLVALYCDRGYIITLLNPCTEEAKTVHMMLNLDKFLWLSKGLYGLSYDSSSREYKVVLALLRVENPTSNLFVVSFKHGEWKVKSLCPLMGKDSFIMSSNDAGTIVNGVPHWIAFENHHDRVSGQRRTCDQIWFFDQFEEEFRKISGMPIEWGRKELRSLGALDGKLTAIVSRVRGKTRDVGGYEVWVLTDFANPESWNRLFVIVNKWRHVSPLLSMNDEEVLIDVNWVDQLIDVSRQELMIYNHKSRTIRELQSNMNRKFYDIVTYYPTLISPTTT